MTFSKSETYTFIDNNISRTFVEKFLAKLGFQNIKYRLTIEQGTIELMVWYDKISVSDKSILED